MALQKFLRCAVLVFVLAACGEQETPTQDADLLSTVQALQTQVGEKETTPVGPSTEEAPRMAPSPSPLAATPGNEQAGQFTEFPIVGQLGGSAYAVAVQGELAFLGVGPRLVILDISQPASPVQIGQSDVFPGVVYDVAVQGETAYVVTGYVGGLYILDIRDPGAPREISHLDGPPTGCNGLVLVGDLAYLGCNPFGLRIVDISVPQAPVEVGSLEMKQAVVDLGLDGTTACLVIAGEGISLVDVSDPSRPAKVGFFPHPERLSEAHPDTVYFMSVATSDGYAFLSAGDAGMAVVDIRNPADPQLAGSFNSNVTNGIAVDGNMAYLVDEFDGVYLLDVSDPANPTQLGLVPSVMGTPDELNVVTAASRGVDVADGRLFVSDAWHSLYILDVADPVTPSRLGHFQAAAPDRLVDVVVAGQYAYLIGGSSGLRVVDVSDPDNLRELAYDDRRINVNLQVPTAIEWAEDHVYISDANIGFHIYDVTDPSQPVEVGLIQDIGFVRDLYLRGDYAYLATQDWQEDNVPRLLVVDVRNPANPQVVKRLDIPLDKDHIAWQMSGEGEYLYLLDFSMGSGSPQPLYIYSLTEAANPVLEAQAALYMPLLNGGNLLVQDRSLYVTSLFPPLQIYDLQDPLVPQLIGQIPMMGLGDDLEKSGSTLLGVPNSLAAYDVANPSDPVFVGLSYTPSNTFGLEVDGDLAYVVGLDFGLMIYKWR